MTKLLLAALMLWAASARADDAFGRDEDLSDSRQAVSGVGLRAAYLDDWGPGVQGRLRLDKATVGELSVDYHRHTVPVQASLLGYFNPDAKASMYMIFGLGWYTVHYPHTGAGLSFVLSDHWSLDASYRFLFTGVYRLSDWKHPVGDHYDVRGHMATVGLNYRFYDPR